MREEVKQWLALLELVEKDQLDPGPALSGELNFNDQYWLPFKEVSALVTDCEAALSFWHRLGTAVEKYFDHYPPINLAFSRSQVESLIFSELNKRNKIQAIRGVPELVIKNELTKIDYKPLWSVELELALENQLHSKSLIKAGRGPIGALVSYETLRQLENEYSYFLSQEDDLIGQKMRARLIREFPLLKGPIQKITSLPPRGVLSRWLDLGYLMVSSLLLFFLILGTYLQMRKKSQ